MRFGGILVGLAAVGAVACGGDDAPVDDTDNDGRITVAQSGFEVNRAVDVLIVVDDGSAAGKQDRFAQALPRFFESLAALPGGLPDLHIGVVSMDLGLRGSAETVPATGVPGCFGNGKNGELQLSGAAVDDAFIVDIAQPDGTRLTNYDGTREDVLGRMVLLGAAGCGFEQPLAAMRLALGNQVANAGFVRPEANLAVIFVGDEDDCSVEHTSFFNPDTSVLGNLTSFRCTRFGVTCTGGGQTSDEMDEPGMKTGCTSATDSAYLTNVSAFADFLVAIKGDARKVSVSAIVGPPEPVVVELRTPQNGASRETALAHACTYQGDSNVEVMDPAVRLHVFKQAFPAATTFADSTCAADGLDNAEGAARAIKNMIGTPCIDQPLVGTAPTYDCIVEIVASNGTATPLPHCDVRSAPCWRIETDEALCPADELAVKIETAVAPPAGAGFRARCRVN